MYLKYSYNAPRMSPFACVTSSAVVTPDERTEIDLDLQDGIQTIAQSMLIHGWTILKSILNQRHTVPKT